MDVLVSLAQLAAYLALALGLGLPHLRRTARWTLLLAALLTLAQGLTAPAGRTLQTVHHYAGYEGASLEVSMVAFPTGTVTAPGWQWPLPFVAFAVLWLLVLAPLGDRPVRRALPLPLLFAWSAAATWLGMQALAAPSAVVQPVGADRFLWPAGLAATLLAARLAKGLMPLIAYLSAVVVFARLPLALFGKLASDLHLGTCLDATLVVDGAGRSLVNPLTKEMFSPPLEAGTPLHQFWLIWLENVIIFPALHSLGLFGIGLGAWLWHRHSDDPV